MTRYLLLSSPLSSALGGKLRCVTNELGTFTHILQIVRLNGVATKLGGDNPSRPAEKKELSSLTRYWATGKVLQILRPPQNSDGVRYCRPHRLIGKQPSDTFEFVNFLISVIVKAVLGLELDVTNQRADELVCAVKVRLPLYTQALFPVLRSPLTFSFGVALVGEVRTKQRRKETNDRTRRDEAQVTQEFHHEFKAKVAPGIQKVVHTTRAGIRLREDADFSSWSARATAHTSRLLEDGTR